MNSLLHARGKEIGRRASVLLLGLLLSAPLLLALPETLSAERIVDEFDRLEGWQELSFRNIERGTTYESARNGELLRVYSVGGASMLVLDGEIDVYDTPVLRWRWRVTGDLERQNLRTKEGDDGPIRLYLAFRQPIKERSFGERIWAGLQENLYGQTPPDSALSFVWSSREEPDQAFQSSYTEKQYLIVPPIEGDGAYEVGVWLEHEVNIVETYRGVFDEDPPAEAFIAVMGDSDNTDGRSEAWLDYLRLTKE